MIQKPILIVVLVAMLAASGVAQAQSAEEAAQAEALNKKGKREVKELRLKEAAESFRGAIGLVADARYYFNLCFTLEKLGSRAEAKLACDTALQLEPPRDLREKLRKQLRGMADGEQGKNDDRPTDDGKPTSEELRLSSVPSSTVVETRGSLFSWAISVGASLSFWSAREDEPLPWPTVGIFLRRELSRYLSIDAGAEYVRKGAWQALTLDYVQLPVAVRVQSQGRPAVFGQAGIVPAVLLADRFPGLRHHDTDTSLQNEVVGVPRFDLGLVVGAGMELSRGSSLRVQFVQGLIDMEYTLVRGGPIIPGDTFRGREEFTTTTTDFRNRSIDLSYVYAFH